MSEIRDYMAEYIEEKGTLDPQEFYVNNWSLLPAEVYGGAAPATLPESGDSANTDLIYIFLLLVGGGLVIAGFYARRRYINIK